MTTKRKSYGERWAHVNGWDEVVLEIDPQATKERAATDPAFATAEITHARDHYWREAPMTDEERACFMARRRG